jgi:prepilin signal peptidase PulO-like enzyme (type II secretory pathway)
MPDLFIALSLGLFGLVLGSFAGATVWRLRARQLLFDRRAGEKVDAKEWKQLKPLTESRLSSDRSRCLHCGYTLRWYDLVPLISWLSLGGKCRNCRRPIGTFEPLIELGMAALFIISYLFWPFPIEDGVTIVLFASWLLASVGLVILFAYDRKWFLLPDSVNFSIIGVGLVSVLLTAVALDDWASVLLNALGSVAILSGLYLLLYVVSRGRWIGFGDVKLGLGLGLLLGDWQLAFLALFLANLIGCLIVIPLMVQGKVTRTTQVPFGPLLILGAIIAKLFGMTIIGWYLSAFI